VKFFYNLFIALYPKIAWLIRSRNRKAALWLDGRKELFRNLSAAMGPNPGKVLWMHCASLGEFEQGRPLLERFRKDYPSYKVLLTFFSPSGYEARKGYEGADWIFYLPMDSNSNARQFFNIVRPSLVIFVKYEFWYYYLCETCQRKIPLLLVSSIFRPQQPFFRWYGGFHRKILGFFTYLFVQDAASMELLNRIGIKDNVAISGDTRFDRVMEIAEQFKPILSVEQFIGNSKVVVAGSTWTDDDEELDHFANTNPDVKFIIAPHEIEQERLQECLRLYRKSVLLSHLSQVPLTDQNVLIIDNIGMLSKLYHYATVSYVGGGFGADGVHNVLEAAVYSKPVVFGPVYDKFIEAAGLIDAGGAFSVSNALQLEKVLGELLGKQESYYEAAVKAGSFVKHHAGASEKILAYIQEKRLLTN